MTADKTTTEESEWTPREELVIESVANGVTYRETADATGVSKATICRWMKKAAFRAAVWQRQSANFAGPARLAAMDRMWNYRELHRLYHLCPDEEWAEKRAFLAQMDGFAIDGIEFAAVEELEATE
ncbi:MAG: helix-turn-helix domain-containing protein [Fuerstiella sp.]|nr:helix-turn-helix domain-containing protein [Fuerstiella sp.]MCP4853068.1 helix-turn-helix domain-containing protein [Fuerstiella sp.]